MHSYRHKFAHFFESHLFQKILLFVILIDAISIGLETVKEIKHDFGHELDVFEYFILGLFSLEMIVKIIVFRGEFFKKGWNLFDLGVVIMSLLPHAAGLSILRSFRVIHSISLFELSPHTRHIVSAIRHVGPSALNVIVFMAVGFYVLAVIGVELFSEEFPDRFGSLGWSLFTLFRLMIYDDYGRITEPILVAYPYSWIFFLSATLILAFVLLNLFVAVVVTALQRAVQDDADPLERKVREELRTVRMEAQEIAELKAEIQEIKALLKKGNPA